MDLHQHSNPNRVPVSSLTPNYQPGSPLPIPLAVPQFEMNQIHMQSQMQNVGHVGPHIHVGQHHSPGPHGHSGHHGHGGHGGHHSPGAGPPHGHNGPHISIGQHHSPGPHGHSHSPGGHHTVHSPGNPHGHSPHGHGGHHGHSGLHSPGAPHAHSQPHVSIVQHHSPGNGPHGSNGPHGHSQHSGGPHGQPSGQGQGQSQSQHSSGSGHSGGPHGPGPSGPLNMRESVRNTNDDTDGMDDMNHKVINALFPLIDDICVMTKNVGRFGVKLMSMSILDKSKFDDIMDDRDDYARVYKLYNGALRINAGRKLVEALLLSDNYNVIHFLKQNIQEPDVLMEMERIQRHVSETANITFGEPPKPPLQSQSQSHHSAETSAAATLLLLESRGNNNSNNNTSNNSSNNNNHSNQGAPTNSNANNNNHPTLNTELTRGSYDALLQQSLGSSGSGEHSTPKNVASYSSTLSMLGFNSSQTQPTSSASSTSTSQSAADKVKHKRRKKAAPDEWERAKNKKLRMQGLEYMGYKKSKDGGVEKNILIVRKKRQIGPPCSSRKCSLGTYTSCGKFTDEARQNIFQNFWTRMNWEQRKIYVSSLVDVVKIKRSTVTGHESRRSSSLRYMLKLNGEKKRVCKQMFLSTLGIGSHSVHSWILKPDGPGSGGSRNLKRNRQPPPGSVSGSGYASAGSGGSGSTTTTGIYDPISGMSLTLTSTPKRRGRRPGSGKANPTPNKAVVPKIEPDFISTPTSTITATFSAAAVQQATMAAALEQQQEISGNFMDSNSNISHNSNSNNSTNNSLADADDGEEEHEEDHDHDQDHGLHDDQEEMDDEDEEMDDMDEENEGEEENENDNDNEIDNENDNDRVATAPASASASSTSTPINVPEGNVDCSSLNPGAHFLVKDYFDSLVKMPQEYLNIVTD